MNSYLTTRWRIKRSWEKNGPELLALCSGYMPSFAWSPGSKPPHPPPVFVFHETQTKTFEATLRYLVENEYRTLDALEFTHSLERNSHREKTVVLSFDDGDWTFWTHAYPLLKKYNCKAILFVVPGLTADDATAYPQYGNNVSTVLEARRQVQPMCTWWELEIMQASGRVDVQSHSLHHSRVFTGPTVLGIVGADPLDDLHHTALPRYADWFENGQYRKPPVGSPIFQYAPLTQGKARFIEDAGFVNSIREMVEKWGGKQLFANADWKKRISTFIRRWPPDQRGCFEPWPTTQKSIADDLAQSKALLERRLHKKVEHFCYPWFLSSRDSDRIAESVGYRYLYYGPYVSRSSAGFVPRRIARLPGEYIFRLPGRGRRSLPVFWLSMVAQRIFSKRRQLA